MSEKDPHKAELLAAGDDVLALYTAESKSWKKATILRANLPDGRVPHSSLAYSLIVTDAH